MSKKGKGRVVTSRISVTEATRDRVREFANGLGAEYDDALNFLLDRVMEGPEVDALILGHKLRKDYEYWLDPKVPF